MLNMNRMYSGCPCKGGQMWIRDVPENLLGGSPCRKTAKLDLPVPHSLQTSLFFRGGEAIPPLDSSPGLSMWEGLEWASPSHCSRRVWENFELWSKNCLPNFNRQLFTAYFPPVSLCSAVCQTSTPPIPKKHREPCSSLMWIKNPIRSCRKIIFGNVTKSHY